VESIVSINKNNKINMKGKSKMSVSHKRIVEACRPILENAGFHDAQTRHPRRFITGYQIWHILKENNDSIYPELESEYGTAQGKGGGSTDGAKRNGDIVDGPVKRIGQALGNCSGIETQYLDTRHLQFNGIKPTGKDCGLFRLKD
jgi:hypothetical protein